MCPKIFATKPKKFSAPRRTSSLAKNALLDRKTNAAKNPDSRRLSSRSGPLHRKRFVILDFEGEPARPLSERKLKRSALRDVAGMMRSFQYAAYSALWQPAMRAEDVPFLERWADLWYRQMSSTFLQSYLRTASGAMFVPQNSDDLQILLEAYLLDKAVYEIGYELNNRPIGSSSPSAASNTF